MNKITWNEFEKIDIRVGTIMEAIDFPEAEKVAYRLRVNLGKQLGIKNTSAQITTLYTKRELIGMQVLVAVNLHPKKIGPFLSECLIMGFYKQEFSVVLAVSDKKIENGLRLV